MSNGLKKAVVLVSGGLDSATVLAIANQLGYVCHALSFDYGQRHRVELKRAAQVARQFSVVDHKVAKIDLGHFGGSALTDVDIDVPTNFDVQEASEGKEDIPVTYVPARNTVFLAMALGWAEVLSADTIFIGANAVDYSGYPDCRPEFIQAFTDLANVATKQGVEGRPFQVLAPLITMTKAEIIAKGIELGVDYGLTLSCYNPSDAGEPCGECDSCHIRARGFAAAGVPDPALN